MKPMRIASLLFHDVYRRDASESGFRGPSADRYKMHVDEFDEAIEAVSGVRSEHPIVGVERVNGFGEAFAITVDDGGVSYFTMVADRLESRGWRGHCFVTTDMIGRDGFLNREQIRELDRRGHLIGSHSASHPTRFAACSWKQMLDEWQISRAVLEDLLGHGVTTASLPGGYFSWRVARAAAEAGLAVLFTSEPECRLRSLEGCTVVGRFTIRPGADPDAICALATFSPLAIWHEWSIWNAKKIVKPLLGAAYPRLGTWIGAPVAKQKP